MHQFCMAHFLVGSHGAIFFLAVRITFLGAFFSLGQC
jgi:hypothetical protein